MRNLIYVYLLLCLLGSACDTAYNDFESVQVEERYEIALPTHMEAVNDLNREASLQYQNASKEMYIIIIDEPLEDLIDTFTQLGEYDKELSEVENYRNIQLGFLKEDMNVVEKGKPRTLEVNGLQAELVHLEGAISDTNEQIAYLAGFLTSNTRAYMIMAWTLENNKEKHMDTFEQMIRSFKEI
ncbi:MAG: hypothetical protein AAF734_09735 [Bacteroidota bacterium]